MPYLIIGLLAGGLLFRTAQDLAREVLRAHIRRGLIQSIMMNVGQALLISLAYVAASKTGAAGARIAAWALVSVLSVVNSIRLLGTLLALSRTLRGPVGTLLNFLRISILHELFHFEAIALGACVILLTGGRLEASRAFTYPSEEIAALLNQVWHAFHWWAPRRPGAVWWIARIALHALALGIELLGTAIAFDVESAPIWAPWRDTRVTFDLVIWGLATAIAAGILLTNVVLI